MVGSPCLGGIIPTQTSLVHAPSNVWQTLYLNKGSKGIIPGGVQGMQRSTVEIAALSLDGVLGPSTLPSLNKCQILAFIRDLWGFFVILGVYK